MTPDFCCGFECGIGGHWTVSYFSGGSVSAETSPIRSGARSCRLTLVSATGWAGISRSVTATQTPVYRVYVNFAVLPDSDIPIFGGTLGVNCYGVAFQASDAKLYAGKINNDGSSIVVGSSGFTPSTGIWYRLDIKVNSSANPILVDAQIDGVSLGQASIAIASGNIDGPASGRRSTGVSASYDFYLEDVVVSNTGGDYPIGDGYVNHFIPTSDGTHNVAGAADFKRGAAGADITNSTTDSYLLVDEVPMDDTTPDTNDYINAIAPPNATDYTENKFGPAPGVSTPTTGPRAVEVITANHQAGTGSGVSATKLNDNGTEDTVMSLSGAGATTTRYYRKHYAAMVGGGAWTAARFNNLRVRFGYSSDANPDQYFDCAMIEAEFEDVSAPSASLAWTSA